MLIEGKLIEGMLIEGMLIEGMMIEGMLTEGMTIDGSDSSEDGNGNASSVEVGSFACAVMERFSIVISGAVSVCSRVTLGFPVETGASALSPTAGGCDERA